MRVRVESASALRGGRPIEFRTQSIVDGTTVARGWRTSGCVIEGVVSRGQSLGIKPQQVGHDCADSSFLVIEHNGCTASRARSQLWRTIRILGVERLTIQAAEVIDLQVSVIKEDTVRAVLPGNAFANRDVLIVCASLFFRKGSRSRLLPMFPDRRHRK